MLTFFPLHRTLKRPRRRSRRLRLRRSRRRRVRSPRPALLRPTETPPPRTGRSPTLRSRRSPRRLSRPPLRTRRRTRLLPHEQITRSEKPTRGGGRDDGMTGSEGKKQSPSYLSSFTPGIVNIEATLHFSFCLLLFDVFSAGYKKQGDLHNGPWGCFSLFNANRELFSSGISKQEIALLLLICAFLLLHRCAQSLPVLETKLIPCLDRCIYVTWHPCGVDATIWEKKNQAASPKS